MCKISKSLASHSQMAFPLHLMFNIWPPPMSILYALKIQRAHGLCRMAMRAVFRSVILARLLYASPAWWGFAGAQVFCSFLRRSARAGFYSSDLPSFDDLCIQTDQNLFKTVLHNPDHVLHRILPPAHSSHNYCLRPRAHDRSLPERLAH